MSTVRQEELLLNKLCAALGAKALTPQEAAQQPKDSLRALVLHGDPEDEAQWERIREALKPGALTAYVPSTATGHAGAILAEQVGLDVWDALFIPTDAGEVFPAAKPSRKERDFGLSGVLEPHAGHEAVNRKEGSAGVKNARAGAGRTAKAVLNNHPTVKPIAVMRSIATFLGVCGIKEKGYVLDPFAGSGTTGIACVESGVPVILIEENPDHAKLSEARVGTLAALRCSE